MISQSIYNRRSNQEARARNLPGSKHAGGDTHSVIPGDISMHRGHIEVDQEAINREAIVELAKSTHRPVPVVKRVYDEQFARLQSQARITDYLVLFASRRTRDVLTGRAV